MARLVMTMALAMTLVAAAGAVVLLVVTAFLALDGAGGGRRRRVCVPRAPRRAQRLQLARGERLLEASEDAEGAVLELARARHVAVVAVAEGVRAAVPHEQREELVGHDDDARGALGALARPREVDARERRRERGRQEALTNRTLVR